MAGLAPLSIAGHYNATLDLSTIGCTMDGFRITPTNSVDPVVVDCFGDTMIDGVYRGQNVTVDFQMSEFTQPAVDKILKNFGTTEGAIEDIGRLVVKHGLAKALVLTPAYADTGKDTYTFPHVFPQGPKAFNLNNRLRVLSVSLMCFPDENNKLWIAS
jgi:hypothetical protein